VSAPYLDLTEAILWESASLYEVGQGDIRSAAPIFGGRYRFLVVEVIRRVGRIKRLHVLKCEAAETVEVAAVDTDSQACPGRCIDRQIGVVEGEIVKSAAVQPGVASGKDIAEKRRVRRSTVGKGQATVGGKGETGKTGRVFVSAAATKQRVAKPLGIIKTHEDGLCIGC